MVTTLHWGGLRGHAGVKGVWVLAARWDGAVVQPMLVTLARKALSLVCKALFRTMYVTVSLAGFQLAAHIMLHARHGTRRLVIDAQGQQCQGIAHEHVVSCCCSRLCKLAPPAHACLQ